ncbi:hypothetical protein YC2023_027721 [Brassica napus]
MAADEDDIRCLGGIQTALTDPKGNNQENIVINLELPDMGLSGRIPESLQYCGSLQKLDLSSNRFSGNIPPKLSGVFGVWWYYYTRKRSSLNKGVSSLAQRLCSHLLAQVSSIQKPLVKVKLGDLMGYGCN